MSVIAFWYENKHPITLYNSLRENAEYKTTSQKQKQGKPVMKISNINVSKDPNYITAKEASAIIGLGFVLMRRKILEHNPDAVCYQPTSMGSYYLKSDVLNLKQE